MQFRLICIGNRINIFQSRLLESFDNAHIKKLTAPKVLNIRLRIPTPDAEAEKSIRQQRGS